ARQPGRVARGGHCLREGTVVETGEGAALAQTPAAFGGHQPLEPPAERLRRAKLAQLQPRGEECVLRGIPGLVVVVEEAGGRSERHRLKRACNFLERSVPQRSWNAAIASALDPVGDGVRCQPRSSRTRKAKN